MKWHRLQKTKEHRMNAQWKEVVLIENEYQDEVLMCKLEYDSLLDDSNEDIEERTIEYFLNFVESSEQQEGLMIETLREAKRSTDFKSDNLCMFAGIKHDGGQFPDIFIQEKEKKHNFNFVLKKDETIRSHMEAHTRLKEEVIFQHTAKVESRGRLAHIDSQKKTELRKGGIKHIYAMLEEDEKKNIEDFHSHVKDLEQQEEYLMNEPPNKTIGSCDFETDNLSVFAGIAEDNPSYGHVLSEVETH